MVCIEAGLSLDQATIRTTHELSFAHPAISDELSMVVLEQRAGRPRTEAWKHLAERTDVDNLRNLVTVLVQSEQFGTSIAKTLRTHSDTLRTQRIQKVEEMAAKDDSQADLSACAVYLPFSLRRCSRTCIHHDAGIIQRILQPLRKGDLP